MFLRPMVYTLFILSFILTYSDNSNAELIYHEISYPEGSGPFPAVITLHTSGGFKPTKKNIENYKVRCGQILVMLFTLQIFSKNMV